jgi:hypothetical protein
MLNLDEIEARVNAATPEPWVTDTSHGPYEVSVNGPVPIPCHHEPPQDEYSVMFQTCHDYTFEQSKKNLVFIAHARSDIPALIAEVRRLRKIVRALDEVLVVSGTCLPDDADFDKTKAVLNEFALHSQNIGEHFERDRMRGVMEDEPHDKDCQYIQSLFCSMMSFEPTPVDPCDCWKAGL